MYAYKAALARLGSRQMLGIGMLAFLALVLTYTLGGSKDESNSARVLRFPPSRSSSVKSSSGRVSDPSSWRLALSLDDEIIAGMFLVTEMKTRPPFQMVVGRETDNMASMLAGNGIYAPSETSVFRHVLFERCSKGEFMVDVGANWGYMGLYAARMGCRVLFVEPNPRLVRAIYLSAELNGFADRIEVLHGVAAASRGQVEFAVPAGQSGMSKVAGAKSDKTFTVTAYSLAAELEARNINKIALMKVDTEGFEHEVFKGLQSFNGLHQIDNFVVEIKFAIGDGTAKRNWLQERLDDGMQVFSFEEKYYGPFPEWLADDQPYYQVCNIMKLRPLTDVARAPGEDFWVTRQVDTHCSFEKK